MTQYVHHVPGRLRVRSIAVKHDPAQALAVKGRIGGLPGVQAVQVRPVTGSITVTYDATSTSVHAIMGALKAQGHVHADTPTHFTVSAPAAASLPTNKIASTVATVAVEKALERSAAAIIAAIF
jgi:copper chaperone CopZ